MKNNPIIDKSFRFAIQVVNAFRNSFDPGTDACLKRQFLRCGTSIGANIEEGIGGQSKRDFIYKFQISYKECRECLYWLNLFKETGIMKIEKADHLIALCIELKIMLQAILKTSKTNQ